MPSIHLEFNDLFPFSIELHEESCEVASEAVIYFSDEIIGYVGGSRYEDIVLEAAKDVVTEKLKELYAPVIAAIKADREIDAVSRFVDLEDFHKYGTS